MKFSRKTYLILSSVALLLLAVFLWVQGVGPGALEFRDTTASQPSQDTASTTKSRPPRDSSATGSEASPAKNPIPNAASSEHGTADAGGPEKTRASDRDAIVTPSGVRKSVVDPMASWADLPPWPEGPRLYAEVETSSKRYINLRPDDFGVLPRISTNPGERLDIKITIPEAEAGEKIHVELPNGGVFTDSEVVGRIYDVLPGHSFSFAVFADDARGKCNVKLRHRGHTRSIALWVGEPEENGT